MTTTGIQLRAVARLELADVLRSRWLLFNLFVYALLAGGFVLVGMRESTVLGFTGMGRVLLSLSHALVFLLPLLALTATVQVVNGARDDGTIELLFGHPLKRGDYFLGITLVRLGILILPLLVLMPAMAVWGLAAYGQRIPWAYLARALLVSTVLLACFVAIGLAISVAIRDRAKALIAAMLVWAAATSLIDFGLIGLLLQWRLSPELVFTLAALNPVQDARLALLAAAEPDLGTLGPVGFFLHTKIGDAGLLAIGLGWPTLLAATAWSWALGRFRRTDLL